jgi:glycosyltransferase involved in cell wall biosynthesis
MHAVGLDKDDVLFPDPHKYRMGYSDEEMAALYTGMDILLHTSYGEGFGVPSIESQVCGTPVIASSWTASLELAGPDSYLVEGQPFWDEAQLSWFQIPNVNSITSALEKAYERGRQEFPETVNFAKAYDVEAVWDAYWLPFLKEKLK